jgi:hypothetical protein
MPGLLGAHQPGMPEFAINCPTFPLLSAHPSRATAFLHAMGPDGLQTFTSAVQVVQLAYEIYKFFRNVSAADAQARAVYKKIWRLHEVIQSVDQVLACREQQRGAEPPAHGEGQVEGSIRACHNACYRLLLAMQDEIKDLTRKESLETAARVWSSLKYTLNSRPKIREYEQSLDTHLQTLRTCLQILQWCVLISESHSCSGANLVLLAVSNISGSRTALNLITARPTAA